MEDQQSDQEVLSVSTDVLADAIGSKTRFMLVCTLADADEPQRQYELAETLGVSEPSVSRAKSLLTDTGIVTETPNGLTVPDDIERAINTLRARVVTDGETEVAA